MAIPEQKALNWVPEGRHFNAKRNSPHNWSFFSFFLLCQPGVFLLNDFRTKQLSKYNVLLANMLTATTQLIASHWKTETIQSKDEWLIKVRHVFVFCELLAINKYKLGHLQTLGKFSGAGPPPHPLSFYFLRVKQFNHSSVISAFLCSINFQLIQVYH